MSSFRQGVLRAVRLLPDVVTIGIDSETDLSSAEEEGQLPDSAPSPGGETDTQTKENETDSASGELKRLSDQVALLRSGLLAMEAEKTRLEGKTAALEAELTSVRDVFSRKEQEITAGIAAEKERARNEGKVQGHAEGLERGYGEGQEKARAEAEARYREKFSALIALLEGTAKRLEENFTELAVLNEPRMLRLWQTMLEKMLGREIALAPNSVLKVLADILTRLSDKNQVLIYVSPEDLRMVDEGIKGEFGEILRGVRRLELKPDSGVDRGSCLVETDLGVYDARWRTQLEQIGSTVEKLLGKPGRKRAGNG